MAAVSLMLSERHSGAGQGECCRALAFGFGLCEIFWRSSGRVRAKPWLTNSASRDRLRGQAGGVVGWGESGQRMDGALGQAGQHFGQILANRDARLAAALDDGEESCDLIDPARKECVYAA